MTKKTDDMRRSQNKIKLLLMKWTQNLRKLLVKRNHAQIFVALVFLVFLAAATLAAQNFHQEIVSSGTIRVIGVSLFWDQARSDKVKSVDWGTLSPGTTIDRCAYVFNNGTANVKLAMSYGNWTPAVAGSYLTLAWNCSNYVLAPSAVVCAKLTLTIQPNITGVTNFNFIIHIKSTD
jgi:hypothetical protein